MYLSRYLKTGNKVCIYIMTTYEIKCKKIDITDNKYEGILNHDP